jgi:hypothetical protein
LEIDCEESEEEVVGTLNSGENIAEEPHPMTLLEDEDATPSIRGVFLALAVACWASERFKENEAEGESGVLLDASNCMKKRRLCRRTKARCIRKSR